MLEKKIQLLIAIKKYGLTEDRDDNSTLVEFICKNLLLIGEYWKSKTTIGRTSLWFKKEEQYKKWHLSDIVDTTLALQTGTALGTKSVHNYWWFENELMSIIHSCIDTLMKKHDYISVYTCLLSIEKLCETAVVCKEASYYAEQVEWLTALVENNLVSETDDNETKKAFAGIVEVISILYINLILESTKLYQDYNIESIAEEVIKSLDTRRVIEESPLLSKSKHLDFYQKIQTEIIIERKRITPEWIIKQNVAREEYDYLNMLISIISAGINQYFSLGRKLLEKNLLLESCIMLSRFYEYESKLNRFIYIVQIRKDELCGLHIDKETKWDSFQIEKLKATHEKWKALVPELLSDCSREFTIENWKKREEYPDFLGESYNHICEDAIDSIVNNNTIQFEQDYINLSKMILFYQEYIRTDFLNGKDNYRLEYMYYMYTAPIEEWAQIGGLAILWGEFSSDDTWFNKVNNGAKLVLSKNDVTTDLAEKIIQYIQNRQKFIFGIGSRDIIETNWKQRVEEAIRVHGLCDVENNLFDERLKTNSRLLNAFCSNFMKMGFSSNPSEVFWVMCVNPTLPKDKQFHTRFSWEDAMNE